MFSKYLKLILLFTIAIQASPKLFNSYGNQMEALNSDCKTYRKLSLLPKDIKKKCKIYNSKVNRAFKYGHKLDSSVDSDNINLDKAEKYNTYLHGLEENKDYILHLLREEIYKARKQENIKYYSQLITSNEIALGDSDYSFMKKHEEKFDKNPKYIMHELDLCEQMVIRLKKEKETMRLEHERFKKAMSFKKESTRLRHEEKVASLKKEKETMRLGHEHFKKAMSFKKEATRLRHEEEIASLENGKEAIHLEYEEEIANLEKEKRTIRLEYQRFKKANEVTSLNKAKEIMLLDFRKKLKPIVDKLKEAREKEKIRQAKEKKSYKSSTTRSSYRPINSSPRMSEVDLFNRCMDSCNMATIGLTTERAFNACFAKCQ